MDEKKEDSQAFEKPGEMKKRRELMADNRRYIIYYTFGNDENNSQPSEENVNV